MEFSYVFTTNGRIFYTSTSLNDRFTQYQVFSPAGCRLDCRGYFADREPKRHEISPSWNMFATAPIIWDSNFQGSSGVWTFFGDSPWVSSDRHEPEIHRPVPVANRKRKRPKRKKKSKNPARKTLSKEQLDDELDRYMMDVK